MLLKKLLFLASIAFILVSCQFTETMVINEDGSGQMRISMDMSEMMAMMPTQDTTQQVIDSVISFKQIFDEKRDSISKLPQAEQEKLKLLEDYQMHMVMNADEGIMTYEIFTDFTSVDEANNLMQGLSATGGSKISTGTTTSQSSTGSAQDQPTAVKYSFENNVFKRDGYIKDQALFQKQLDSIKQMEAFMEEAYYSIHYTFPKKIKKVSIKDADISNDGKTVTFKRKFIAYIKDPDVLDVEIVLENN